MLSLCVFLMTFYFVVVIIILVGGSIMNYKNKKAEKMQELFELKKSYSSAKEKSYVKISDALVISNDRLNTLVLTFGVIVCSIFIGLFVK